MNFFKKFFKTEKTSEQEPESKDLGHLPMEEQFVQNFISKGGKFLYCTSRQEVLDNFEKVCEENNWKEFQYYKNNPLEVLDLNLSDKIKMNTSAGVYISTCEYLIAKDGSILLSSEQIGEKKIANLPKNFIVIAQTSLIVQNKRDALHGINWRSEAIKPTNISTIKSFSPNDNSEDILKNYGTSNSKNLYLLLLEDL